MRKSGFTVSGYRTSEFISEKFSRGPIRLGRAEFWAPKFEDFRWRMPICIKSRNNIFIGGNGGSAQSTAFWGVPGSSFPKSNSSKKKTPPPAKPIKKTGELKLSNDS